jgi:riboflavin transporter FmnP
MAQNEIYPSDRRSCGRCSEKSRCREVFRQLGEAQGKSIIPSVLLAFVLPLLIFVAGLAVSLEVLAKYVESVGFRTAFALVLAIVASAVFVAIVKIVSRWLDRR